MSADEYSPGLAIAWQLAAAEAGQAGFARILPGHLAVGLLSLEKAAAAPPEALGLPPATVASLRAESELLATVLATAGLGVAALRRQLRRRLGPGGERPVAGPVSRAPLARVAFARAEELGGGSPNGLHLLAALLEGGDEILAGELAAAGADRDALLRRLRAATERAPSAAAASMPTLDRFGRDLTRLAADGQLGPFAGRRNELLALLQTLARRSKASPVLVGEPGVGKTALVEALAVRAAAGKDSAVLAGIRLVELSVGALLGGTSYRGELEQRVQDLLAELRAHPEVVLFIDELHTVIGAGRIGSGGADLADFLKPALARGELRMIGATTLEEYRRHVESDPALARRFEAVLVPEPDRADTLAILAALRPRWEEHHGLRVGDAALAAAVDLAERFVSDRRLPDSAIDLVDRAAARLRVPMLSQRAPDAGGGAAAPVAAVALTDRAVAETLAERLGLPLELVCQSLAGDAGSRILALEPALRAALIGQDEAVAAVAQRLRAAHAGLRSERGPLAVLLFLGPSGVGKTELARHLAAFLFGSDRSLVRLDMSEYGEAHSVARLIGAPPGYVGHDEEGQLSSRLRTTPHCVVLLDEVDKAHPAVLDLFLQVFDAGRLTDGRGRTVDARHAIFVLTGNIAPPAAAIGFPDQPDLRQPLLDELRRRYRPELLGRVELIVFRHLDRADAARVLAPRLDRLRELVARRHGVTLTVDDAATALVLEHGYSTAAGVRELERAVERLLQAPLSRLILEGRLAAHPRWLATAAGGRVFVVPDEDD